MKLTEFKDQFVRSGKKIYYIDTTGMPIVPSATDMTSYQRAREELRDMIEQNGLDDDS